MNSKITKDIGVVCYSITSSKGFSATWYSSELNDCKLGTGIAHGDTTNGFNGYYEITYQLADGTSLGSFDLEIQNQNQTYEFLWRQEGLLCLSEMDLNTKIH